MRIPILLQVLDIPVILTSSTNDLEKRMCDHNRGKTAFAKIGMPWELKYFETFQTKPEAVRREMEIKARKSRSYIEELILSKPK